tara:strand:- start:1128 stop:1835 length:708 start_codon:yes stop_codon:yes gene_type:complete
MIVSVHQPHYIPWPGYFAKIFHSDIFVYYDDAQFVKNTYVNRNKLLFNGDLSFITVPVLKGSSKDSINKKIIVDDKWKIKHLNSLKTYYSKSPNYRILLDMYNEILDFNSLSLCELNIFTIKTICRYLGIHTETFLSSDIVKENDDSTMKLIDIVERHNGKTYLSGTQGSKYLDCHFFTKKKIKIVFGEFQSSHYTHILSNKPTSGASIIDMIAHFSPEFILAYIRNNYLIRSCE